MSPFRSRTEDPSRQSWWLFALPWPEEDDLSGAACGFCVLDCEFLELLRPFDGRPFCLLSTDTEAPSGFTLDSEGYSGSKNT